MEEELENKVLCFVAESGDGVKFGQIRDLLGLDIGPTLQVITELLQFGWIERKVACEMITYYAVTDSGKQAYFNLIRDDNGV